MPFRHADCDDLVEVGLPPAAPMAALQGNRTDSRPSAPTLRRLVIIGLALVCAVVTVALYIALVQEQDDQAESTAPPDYVSSYEIVLRGHVKPMAWPL